MEDTMIHDSDYLDEEEEESKDHPDRHVSEIFVSSTYGAINNDDNPKQERTGPILRKSPTTTQLIKTRFERFFSRIAHCRYDKRRLPTNKQVVVLLFLCCFERAAYYAATAIPIAGLVQSSSVQFSVNLVVQNVFPQLLFPVAGWVGDVYLGRFRAIQLGMLLIALSCSGLLVESTVSYMVYPACLDRAILYHGAGTDSDCTHPIYTVFVVFTFFLLYTGSSLFHANLIPYGADLITYYRSSNDISSYFYWYYWVRNVGGLMICCLSAFCLFGFGSNIISVFSNLFGCICISIALVICFSTKHWFVDENTYTNPYKKSFQIISYALRAKRPRARAAFGIGHDPPPRLDLAKRRHGGKFTNEEVEDVKTVGRLLLLILCFGSINTVRIAAGEANDFQLGRIASVRMFSSIGGYYMQCSPTHSYSWAVGSLLILLIIPLLDQVVFPILGEFTPSMLRRMGIGFCAVMLCCSIQLGIEHAAATMRNLPENMTNITCEKNLQGVLTGYHFLLIAYVPFFLTSLAEISSIVPGLCFVYAQSPSSTRGMMTGLFFAIAGVFSLIGASGSTAVDKFLKPLYNISQTCLFWYYLTILCLSLAGLVVYTVAARMYKNRHRGELETSEPYYFRPRFLNIWGNRRGQKFRDLQRR